MGLFKGLFNNKIKILIVDDDKSICNYLSEALSLENYSVIVSQDPKRGLELAIKQKPALIILDIYMGPPDGIEVLRKLRQEPVTKTIPVIMLTGADRMNDVEAAMELGANAYLIKPCDTGRLFQKVSKLLLNAKAGESPAQSA